VEGILSGHGVHGDHPPLTYKDFEGRFWPEAEPGDLDPEIEGGVIKAVGGFCAPAGGFDFMRPPTPEELAAWEESDRLHRRTWAYRRTRLRSWWRAHWWPARIRDLEERLSDRDDW
jgi:hypothetical protein